MGVKIIDELVSEVLAIEAEEARQAGALGYMSRALVQATMPHKRMESNEFTRRNGAFTLSIMSPSRIGLPYGNIPRLLMAWLTTEAVVKKQRTLCLGNTLSSFMRELDLVPTGGRWGSITRLREQTNRLFMSSISCFYEDDKRDRGIGFRLTDEYDLWWHPKSPNQGTFFESTVTLSETFFHEVTEHPVPIDLRALKFLKRSPMALDIYCWLTYRMSYLHHKTCIPWEVLKIQFGSDYKRTRDFKKYFLNQLHNVIIVYPEAKFDIEDSLLVLQPSKPHIPLSE